MQLDPGWLASQGEDAPLLGWLRKGLSGQTPDGIGIAVSGGGDSMALLHLYLRMAAQTGQHIAAVTVDHGLRAEAAAEAAMVAGFCASVGVSHHILVWQDWDGHGNLQAAARDARYRLIADWARKQGIGCIALGHTLDDAAETFVMRLARKAGIDGLASMDRSFERAGLRWIRPLSQVRRVALRAYLQRHGVAWVDDPSNENEDFTRVRTRKALAVLADLGVTADVVQHAALAAKDARQALEFYARSEARLHVRTDQGDLLLPHAAPVPAEMMRRLKTRAVQWIGGLAYPPRASSLLHADVGLSLEGKATVAGCLLTRENDMIRIAREPNFVRVMRCTTDALWDGRWRLDGPHAPDLQVRALGDGIVACPNWRDTGQPRASLMASPAIWRGDMLIAAPVAGYQNGWQARIVADFHSWLDAH